jgi:hypothetical protein
MTSSMRLDFLYRINTRSKNKTNVTQKHKAMEPTIYTPEQIIYTAAPRSGGRYRIFKRFWKQYQHPSRPQWVRVDTGIITKNPKATMFALTKKDEGERKLKKVA